MRAGGRSGARRGRRGAAGRCRQIAAADAVAAAADGGADLGKTRHRYPKIGISGSRLEFSRRLVGWGIDFRYTLEPSRQEFSNGTRCMPDACLYTCLNACLSTCLNAVALWTFQLRHTPFTTASKNKHNSTSKSKAPYYGIFTHTSKVYPNTPSDIQY